MMVVVAGGQEGRTGEAARRPVDDDAEAEHVAVERDRALEIGDAQVHVPDAGLGVDRCVLGHGGLLECVGCSSRLHPARGGRRFAPWRLPWVSPERYRRAVTSRSTASGWREGGHASACALVPT